MKADLRRYGIEYVEDPTTKRRVPTVNRAQYTSVYDDVNYTQALKHADTAQRELYEREAAEINEIQKGILGYSYSNYNTFRNYHYFRCCFNYPLEH